MKEYSDQPQLRKNFKKSVAGTKRKDRENSKSLRKRFNQRTIEFYNLTPKSLGLVNCEVSLITLAF